MLRVASFGAPFAGSGEATSTQPPASRGPATLAPMRNPGGILALKLAVLGSWFVAAAGFLFPPATTFGDLGRLLFALLAGVHGIECLAFYGTLKRTGRPLVFELLQTLLFGAIHFIEAKALAEAREER